MSRRIYVASSWRNLDQPSVVEALRAAGHSVYDFRSPGSGGLADVLPGVTKETSGFAWGSVDPAWQSWTPEEYRAALLHPIARAGFAADLEAMRWADTCVLVMPSGRSAHLEAGWACGSGRPTAILLSEGEPELMYLFADRICLDLGEVIEWCAGLSAEGLSPLAEDGL